MDLDRKRRRDRMTVGDVWNTLTEKQKALFYRYTFEIYNGYLGNETRKAYAKMALSELNADQLKVLSWMEAMILDAKKEKGDV